MPAGSFIFSKLGMGAGTSAPSTMMRNWSRICMGAHACQLHSKAWFDISYGHAWACMHVSYINRHGLISVTDHGMPVTLFVNCVCKNRNVRIYKIGCMCCITCIYEIKGNSQKTAPPHTKCISNLSHPPPHLLAACWHCTPSSLLYLAPSHTSWLFSSGMCR